MIQMDKPNQTQMELSYFIYQVTMRSKLGANGKANLLYETRSVAMMMMTISITMMTLTFLILYNIYILPEVEAMSLSVNISKRIALG